MKLAEDACLNGKELATSNLTVLKRSLYRACERGNECITLVICKNFIIFEKWSSEYEAFFDFCTVCFFARDGEY